mgnify:FL=1
MSEKRILSPIDGNLEYCFQEDNEKNGVSSYLDYKTGFTSNSLLITDSEYITDLEKTQPAIITELKIEDELLGINWYPSVINVPGKGMVYPIGNRDEWTWESIPVRELEDEEQKEYPIPEQEGKFFKSILDIKLKSTYKKDRFMEALASIGGVVDLDGKGFKEHMDGKS